MLGFFTFFSFEGLIILFKYLGENYVHVTETILTSIKMQAISFNMVTLYSYRTKDIIPVGIKGHNSYC